MLAWSLCEAAQTGVGQFSMADGERIGPGVVKRLKRAAETPRVSVPTTSSPRAVDLKMLEHQLRSAAGELRQREVVELLQRWEAALGAPHELLQKRLPQLYDEWGHTRMLEAINYVVAVQDEVERDPWRMLQQLFHLLRKWRRGRK